MLSIERNEKIIELLDRDRIVKVSALSKLFSVTEKTIRGDLEMLERRGLLRRIHGGAILPNENGGLLPIFDRQSGYSDAKLSIAKLALSLISPGEAILLDGGSTTMALAEILGEFPLTVITNDLKISSILLNKEKIHLIVLGGERIGTSSSLLGPMAAETLQKIHINRLFLGTTGIHPEHGLTVFHSLLAQWKRSIIQHAVYSTLLVDQSKFGQVALFKFADLSQIHEIITDTPLDKEMLAELTKRNIKLITP